LAKIKKKITKYLAISKSSFIFVERNWEMAEAGLQ
jgi:hypothetical protein